MPSLKQKNGALAEGVVDRYLDSLGWPILYRNFRTRWGELDRVALDGAQLVFIEVKARRSEQAFADFPPLQARQMRRIWTTARIFLAEIGWDLEAELDIQEYRFDIIYVRGESIVEHHGDLLLPELMRPLRG